MRKNNILLLFIITILLVVVIVMSGCPSAPVSVEETTEETTTEETTEIITRKKYAIVKNTSPTYNYSEWKSPVYVLAEKYKNKYEYKIFDYNTDINSIKDELASFSPYYIAFVAEPAEINQNFVKDIHQLTRELDEDPYGDAIWGIITGYTVQDALQIAEYNKPLEIKRGLSATGKGWLEYLSEGVGYSEKTPKYKAIKSEDSITVEESMNAPEDTTESFVNELNSGKIDIFWTSGHANEHSWSIGYNYPNGIFSHQKGQLLGINTSEEIYQINSSNPKVYYPVGNCRIGNIDQEDCMMTSWIHSGGAYQAMGYTDDTWYGFMGWGIADYFFKSKYPLSFAESFFLNNQALVFGLEESVASSQKGHEYDKDAVAFYGDPAWRATIKKNENCPYDMDLTKSEEGGKISFKFTVKALKDYEFNSERPPGILLPYKIKNPKIKDTNCNGNIVITENFILTQITKKLKQGEKKYVVFEAHY